jgi:hypothetical protein
VTYAAPRTRVIPVANYIDSKTEFLLLPNGAENEIEIARITDDKILKNSYLFNTLILEIDIKFIPEEELG